MGPVALPRGPPPRLALVTDALAGITALTVAATVATLPLVAFYFHQIPLVGIPVTVLTLPALPFALVSQAAAGLIGLGSTAVAQPFGWLAWISTAYITGIVDLFGRIPSSSVDAGRASVLVLVAYYAVLSLLYVRLFFGRWTYLPRVKPARLPRAEQGLSWWLVAPVVAIAALLWMAAFSAPDQRLHVSFVDVGRGMQRSSPPLAAGRCWWTAGRTRWPSRDSWAGRCRCKTVPST